MQNVLSISGILLLAILISGCSASTADLVESVDDSVLDQLQLSSENAALTVEQSAEHVEVPNPARTNPFSGATEERSPEAGVVRLKGFVHVDKPKVVLVLNETLMVLGEQQDDSGITVLYIRPPEVVYERDGVEHSLSLGSI